MSRERDGIARLREIADGVALTDEISYLAHEIREIAAEYEYLTTAAEKFLTALQKREEGTT